MSKVLGIDLGTTNSCMAVIEDGHARVIPNAEGAATTPSIVSFLTEENHVVGEPALHRVLAHPRTTITSIKRYMGMGYDETQQARAKTNYEVLRGPSGSVRVNIKTRERSPEEIMQMLDARRQQGMNFFGSMVLDGANGTQYAPEQISSFILRKLKDDAAAFCGEEFDQAVITVPAYFNDAQRQATRAAGRLAGLEVLRVVSEPTAAALAYGIGSPDKDERVMIFDLGGGTFDVSILEIRHGVFHVLSTYGDNQLGGDDWDRRLIDWMADEFAKEHGIDLRRDQDAVERLHDAAIAAKIALSGEESTRVFLPGIAAAPARGAGAARLDLDYTLTRRKFEQLCAGLMGRLKIPMDMAMQGAGLKVADLDEVVLVGGSTRMPSVRKMVERYTRIEPSTSVNPDEAVALGAAVQGGLLNGEIKGASLLDVTPLSLGLETAGGVMSVLIPRNTTIPAHAEQVFSTTEDNQTAAAIRVFQGERGMARDNKSLGEFRLVGLPAAPQGKVSIEVSFDIDANGIVAVAAREAESGTEQQIVITDSGNLSAEGIEQMLAEAEAHSGADELFRRTVELENEANSLLYWTRKAIEAHANWVSEQEAQAIRDGIERLQAAVDALEDGASGAAPAVGAGGAAASGADDALAAARAAIDELREVRAPLETAANEVERMRGRKVCSAQCPGNRCPGCGNLTL